ncbi:hypothetical protein LF95_10185 [Thalassospira sp. TSL5-1]|nr:hypothetical protein LF95_10185 [Thalassospira sp. TSL5-1]
MTLTKTLGRKAGVKPCVAFSHKTTICFINAPEEKISIERRDQTNDAACQKAYQSDKMPS